MKIVLENKEAFVTLCDKLLEIKGVESVTYNTEDFKNVAQGWCHVELEVKNFTTFTGSWVYNED